MTDRPFAFICSPFRGDMEANAQKAREYSRLAYEAGYIPLAPHLYFPQFLSEEKPVEREAGIQMGMTLLAQCAVVAVCGGGITEGMAREIRLAKKLGIEACALEKLPPPQLARPSLLAALRPRQADYPSQEGSAGPRDYQR